jgi:deazaflavin-dependent oxidoreductase (nitroreductase family)
MTEQDGATVQAMPSDLVLKTMNRVHRTMMTLSGGRLGWSAGSMPVLELTTVGRKSGQQRSVMLTSPIREGESMVIVASKGGEDTHPAWFLNLQANPNVEVSTKGAPKQPMIARVATSDERARLWPQVTATYKNYGGYQAKTVREIPLVILTPVEGSNSDS